MQRYAFQDTEYAEEYNKNHINLKHKPYRSVKYKFLKYHGHFSTRSDFRAVTIENQVVGIDRMGEYIQSASSLYTV